MLGLGGGAWERRPAAPYSRWKLEGVGFRRSWEVQYLEFFHDAACTREVVTESVVLRVAPILTFTGTVSR